METNLFGDHQAITLISKIKEVFSDIDYPGDDILIPFEDHCGIMARELEELITCSKNKSWQSIPLEVVIRNRESIWCISRYALDYYLPAYMTSAILSVFLKNDNDLLWYFVRYICFQFQGTLENNSDELISQKLKHMPSDQYGIIKEFLRFSKEFLKDDAEVCEMIETALKNCTGV